MRNSTLEHNPQWVPSRRLLLHCMLLMSFYPLASMAGGEFRLNREDVIAIRADQAWEDVEPDTVHFNGHFEMYIRDWLVNADRATLLGQLDEPDRLVLYGSPARFKLSHLQGNQPETVQAEAAEIIYERATGLIILHGNASLGQGENVLRSSTIEYDIETDRFRAQGETGVQINTVTESSNH